MEKKCTNLESEKEKLLEELNKADKTRSQEIQSLEDLSAELQENILKLEENQTLQIPPKKCCKLVRNKRVES